MELGATILKPEDAGGVYPLLLAVSGYAAMERGSEVIEPRDLIKAIYITDPEHVLAFWNNWESFEKLILGERFVSGTTATYINRILYLVRVDSISRENAGS